MVYITSRSLDRIGQYTRFNRTTINSCLINRQTRNSSIQIIKQRSIQIAYDFPVTIIINSFIITTCIIETYP